MVPAIGGTWRWMALARPETRWRGYSSHSTYQQMKSALAHAFRHRKGRTHHEALRIQPGSSKPLALRQGNKTRTPGIDFLHMICDVCLCIQISLGALSGPALVLRPMATAAVRRVGEKLSRFCGAATTYGTCCTPRILHRSVSRSQFHFWVMLACTCCPVEANDPYAQP